MIVEFSTEVDHFQVEGPEQDYLNGEPYSYRGETGGQPHQRDGSRVQADNRPRPPVRQQPS